MPDMPQLEWVAGPGPDPAWQRLPLPPGRHGVGRAPECAVRLADRRASRNHAEITVDSGAAALADHGSANGTFHNGRRLRAGERVALADLDMLVIGDTALRYSAVEREVPRSGGVGGETVVRFLAPGERPVLAEGGGGRDQVGALRLLLDLARDAETVESVGELEILLAGTLGTALGADRLSLRVFPPLARDDDGDGGSGAADTVDGVVGGNGSGGEGGSVGAEALRRARSEGAAVLVHEPGPDGPDAPAPASAIAVPLLADGRLLGILHIERERGGGAAGTMSEAVAGKSDRTGPLGGADLELATAAGWHGALVLLRLVRLAILRAERDRLEADLGRDAGLLGKSPAMARVRDFIGRAGPSPAGVLILGESGTGKELVARALHKASDRRERPFVTVNAAALPEALAEAELFGHTKGAFTGAGQAREGWFAAAHGGTLFLDEIGELSPAVQAKLLRALESGEITPVGAGAKTRRVDVRVVAATHRDLEAAVGDGRFRADLYYRLNILRVELPPLRERAGDIPALTAHFTKLICRQTGRLPLGWTGAALDCLARYGWPGNVRELRNVVERAVILAGGPVLDVADLPPPLSTPPSSLPPPSAAASAASAAPPAESAEVVDPDAAPPLSLAAMEREHIRMVIARAGGNKSKAAAWLGIDRSTLYAKLRPLEEE